MQTIHVVKKTEADGSLSLRIPLGKPDMECEVLVVVQARDVAAVAATPQSRGVLNRLDVHARLDELRTLRDGWFDGAGKGPPAAGLDWFADALRNHLDEELPLPHLFPTPQGGIQAEWSLGPVEASLEIDLERHRARWHWLNIETQAEASRELNLEESGDWQWLSGQIAQICRNQHE